jgi:hypothetical protein
LLPQSASYKFILPEGFHCDHCAMQWWWITDNVGNEHFKSCHDVRIVQAPPTPAPPTNPPTPPTPAPPTAPPTFEPTAQPTPPPTVCVASGQLCQFDGSGTPCCSGTICTGTPNWATCAAGYPDPSPTPAPPAPTEAPPAPTSAPPSPTAPPAPTPAPEPTAPPTVEPTRNVTPPPTTCIANSQVCNVSGSGIPCCAGSTCTGTVHYATCIDDDFCLPDGQVCQFSGEGSPCCDGSTCNGTVNWATCGPTTA